MGKKAPLKKSPSPASSKTPLYLSLFLLGLGGWWIWQSDYFANIKDQLLTYIDNRDLSTLESRYSVEQMIESHRKEILGSGNNEKSLKNTILVYYPYLMLDVKYMTPEHTSREGYVLWSLNNGEIILNTNTWESTHGFRDCLECEATREDFKILQALSKHPGGISLEELQKELRIEREILAPWIDEAKQKHLIVIKGNLLKLHFENPKLLVVPQTKINHPIVSIPQGSNQKAARNYSPNQIITLSRAAFGPEFKVRRQEEIYLPVYRFELLNTDGSIQYSDWNALTGQPIVPDYLRES